MAANFFYRYQWLVETIKRSGYIQFAELQREWQNCWCNENGEPLAKRTFFHHRKAVLEMFGIEIKYDKLLGYHIAEDTVKYVERMENFVSSRKIIEDMAVNFFHRYVWLVDTVLRYGPIELSDIQKQWGNTGVNIDNTSLAERTFFNHRDAIREAMGIDIKYKKGEGYYIENCDEELAGMRGWLYNSITLNNMLSECSDLRDKIFIDEVPAGREYLPTVVSALRDNKELEIVNHEFLEDEPESVTLQPYCLRLLKQRWYVVGVNTADGEIHRYSFDRIEKMTLSGKSFTPSKKIDMQEYFHNLYGMVGGGEKPEIVRIKVIDEQRGYIRSLPLHHSQKEVETTDEYSVFEYFLVPKWNLMMELLSMEDAVEVLEPLHFRKLISGIIKDMYHVYF